MASQKFQLFNGGETDVCPACNGKQRLWYVPDGPDRFDIGMEGWAHWMYCPACPEGRKAKAEAPVYQESEPLAEDPTANIIPFDMFSGYSGDDR